MPGLGQILACAGPLANDFDALVQFTKAIIDAVPARYDATTLDVPWRTIESSSQKLIIGVVPEDPTYPLHPPVKRAMEEAICKIEAAGHTIVRLTADECRIPDTQVVALHMFGLDPKTSLQNINSSGEPVIPSYAKGYKMVSPTPGFLPDLSKLEPLEKLAFLNVKRLELQNIWRKLLLDKKVDVCISPSSQGGPVPHDTFGWPPYTCLFNFLDVSQSSIKDLYMATNQKSILPVSSHSLSLQKPWMLNHSRLMKIKEGQLVSLHTEIESLFKLTLSFRYPRSC